MPARSAALDPACVRDAGSVTPSAGVRNAHESRA